MYKHIEYRNGKCEAYREERPDNPYIPDRRDWDAVNDSEAQYDRDLTEWQATKEIFEFAEGELNKFSKNFKTALVLIDEQARLGNDPGPYNITSFVEIKDGIAYFLEPGKEEESNNKKLFTERDMKAFAIACSLLSLAGNGAIDKVVNEAYDKNYKLK